MKTGIAGLLATAIVLSLLPCAPLSAADTQVAWRTGRVLAANLSGHGPSKTSPSKRARSGDVWWTYCISSGGKTYSAVSRLSPAKSGLSVKSTVRLNIVKNQMTVLNSRRVRHVLRILRQDENGGCR